MEALVLIPILYVVVVVGFGINWMCDGHERTQERFWSVMGLVLVWPLWLAIKIVKGVYRGLRDTIKE